MARLIPHSAPTLVLALAVGGSLAYLWHAPEEESHAAPAKLESPQSTPTHTPSAAPESEIKAKQNADALPE